MLPRCRASILKNNELQFSLGGFYEFLFSMVQVIAEFKRKNVFSALNNKIKLAVILLLCFLSRCVFACTYIECENNRLDAEYEAIDKLLNSNYKKLIGMLDGEGVKKLRSIQRYWIQYRDQDCDDLESSWCGSEGCQTFSQRIRAGNEWLTCLISTTDQRNKQFLNAIQAIKNHRAPDFRFDRTKQDVR